MLRLCAGFWGWESRQIPEDTDLWSHTGVRSREASSGRIITCHSSKICDEGKEKAVGGSNTAFASSFEGVCQHGIPTGRTGGVRMWKEKVIPGWMWTCLFYLQLLLFPKWSKNNTRSCQEEGFPLPLIVILCSKEPDVTSLISFLMGSFLSQE